MPIEVNDWFDLDSVRDNLSDEVEFQSDLDQDTDGYEELAGPEANGGAGWDPIGDLDDNHEGNITGNNHTVSDVYIDRPDDELVGLFGVKTGRFGLTTERRTVSGLGLRRFDVTGSGDQDEGGVACFAGVCTLVDFDNCFVVESEVVGDDNVGGWTGFTNGVKTTELWADAVVTGEDAGGLFGTIRARDDDDDHQYDNLFAFGNVTGESDTIGGIPRSGGIVPYITDGDGEDIPNDGAYWDTEATTTDDGVIGTGLTTSEMQGDSPLTTMSEFDFDDDWETQTDDYPILRSFTVNDQRPPVLLELEIEAGSDGDFSVPVIDLPFDNWTLNGAVIGETVEEVRTWDSLELVVRYSGDGIRSLVRSLKSNSEKVDVVDVDSGGFRSVDLSGGDNTFIIEGPDNRDDVRSVDEWLVGGYDDSLLDKDGNVYELELDLVPIMEKSFDNRFGTFDDPPSPTRDSDEWLFDFEFGAVATRRVGVDVTEEPDSSVDVFVLETVMRPEEVRVVEENLGLLNNSVVRNVPDAEDVVEDTSLDGRNTVDITVPDGFTDPLSSGEYIVRSFETEWISGAFRVTLEVAQ